jgi:hypothetical protein
VSRGPQHYSHHTSARIQCKCAAHQGQAAYATLFAAQEEEEVANLTVPDEGQITLIRLHYIFYLPASAWLEALPVAPALHFQWQLHSSNVSPSWGLVPVPKSAHTQNDEARTIVNVLHQNFILHFSMCIVYHPCRATQQSIYLGISRHTHTRLLFRDSSQMNEDLVGNFIRRDDDCRMYRLCATCRMSLERRPPKHPTRVCANSIHIKIVKQLLKIIY